MNVIDHKKFLKRPTPRSQRVQRIAVRVAGTLLIAFVVINVFMALLFGGKALPGTKLGNMSVGGKSYDAIAKELQAKDISDDTIILEKDAIRQKIPVKDLGVALDKKASVQKLKDSRPFFPLFGLFGGSEVAMVMHVDTAVFERKASDLANIFIKQPLEKHIAFEKDSFVIAPAEAGFKLDQPAFADKVRKAVADQRDRMTMPVLEVDAVDTDTDLTSERDRLQKQLNTKITYYIDVSKVQPSKGDMGNWYVASGTSMAPSAEKIAAYVASVASKSGSTASNRSDIALASAYALNRTLSTTLRVTGKDAKLFTYCTATKGVGAGDLDTLIGKLAATYADPRGWNDNGAVAFRHADEGCDFTVWLTAPSQMASFGSICDSYYNCQVGANVIVNNDRWLYATEAWNKTGQDLETYRLLIINHETGHRLGFRDNPVCPVPGQPAPVMMQQSMSLNGCVFNVWPLASEFEALKTML